MMNSLLMLDVAGAPILIASFGAILAVFGAIVFVVVLIVRNIVKMKKDKTDKDPKE